MLEDLKDTLEEYKDILYIQLLHELWSLQISWKYSQIMQRIRSEDLRKMVLERGLT